MENVKKISLLKKIKNTIVRIIIGLVVFILISGILLALPTVQTKIGHYITGILNEDYGTNINVEKVSISVFGGVKLKTIMIRDHHADTLIYANRINTNILDFGKLIDGDLLFGDIKIDGLKFILKNYKGEINTNLDVFVESFDDGTTSSKKFLLQATNAYLTNSRFRIIDENQTQPLSVDFTRINASLSGFKIYGPDVSAKINKLAFKDHRGLTVDNISTKFSYTLAQIALDDLELKTTNSNLKGYVHLNYSREDLADFNNKVQFDGIFDEGKISTNDIRYFYNELGRDISFDIQTKITGTLNDLKLGNLKLINNNASQIVGNINFKNLLGKENQEFFMDGDFYKFSTDYHELNKLLPDVLGKTLPVEIKRLGKFNLLGKIKLNTTKIISDFFVTSALGSVKADLEIDGIEDIDNASYEGNIALENFNIGKFLDVKDLGRMTSRLDIKGSGFKRKNVNTIAKGKISKIYYNQYNYSNILVDGKFKSPFFEGKLNINDPNLFLDFEGFIDLSKKDYRYNFNTKVDYANLKELNFMKDSISVFKGDVSMKVEGNSIDNLSGIIKFSHTAYHNDRENYIFDDFTIESAFDENQERTIIINSPDIIEGRMVGKYEFTQLPKMVENAAGSLYANYTPNKIKKGQYLKFNFTIYNKIIEIFFPEIEIGSNTSVRGLINSDLDEFKLSFNSPKIKASDNYFDKIKISIDNKNPLYNAYIEMDTIKTKFYKFSEFSLINVTSKDTLFARSEFKGGNKAQDVYNLNFYHTIDKDNKSILGFKKSDGKFKDYTWFINEKEASNNKIIFDKNFKNIEIDNFIISHENQKIELVGYIKENDKKNLNLSFENVELEKVLPSIENLEIAGELNGNVHFVQNGEMYRPTSTLKINNLTLNEILLGQLNLDIVGDESLKSFTIGSNIENKNVELFLADGTINYDNQTTNIDLDVRLNNFNLTALSGLGGEVISDIRGFVSGTSNISGNIGNPEINGRLFLDDAGLKIPYLNVDYNLSKNSIVDLADNQFIFQDVNIIDNKYETTGKLNGTIKHKKFIDWILNLKIQSDRLLVLDTKDSEDAAYYGTAFIQGKAQLSGPTNGLLIEVQATSKQGTELKIPINNSESIGSRSFMHFLTAQEKFNLERGIFTTDRNYNGLELKFDLDITPEAEVEVILDRATGHGMKAKGNGTLLLEINTLGKFNMVGDFQVYEGFYNFKYRGLIDKKFELKKFSTIVWDGDPMRARLNLETVYKTFANPSVLLDNPSVNRKVPVEVGIVITGSLSSPEPDFEIKFPTISSVLKSEIQTKLNDKDIRQTQALTLLTTGGFLSEDGVNQSALTQNLFETAGGIFDDIFQNPDDKIKVGIDLVSADRTPGNESDGSVGLTLSSQINERITINGKVGVPVGGVNESAVVGNVEVQYRVNEDGSLNLRVFNRENDINYIGEGIGYTQGVGITYEVDFDTFKELVNKIFKSKKLERASDTMDYIDEDSEMMPDYMNFQDEKKKTESPKPPKEAIPSKED